MMMFVYVVSKRLRDARNILYSNLRHSIYIYSMYVSQKLNCFIRQFIHKWSHIHDDLERSFQIRTHLSNECFCTGQGYIFDLFFYSV